VPADEDVLALEDVLVVHDLLGEDLAVVGDLSPHVIDQVWLSEVVFVVGVGHGFEVEGHGSA